MRANETLTLAQNAAIDAEERKSAELFDEKTEPAPPPSDEDLQDGVRHAEAMTQSWSRSSLITLYVLYVPSYFLLTPVSGCCTQRTRSKAASPGTCPRTSLPSSPSTVSSP